MTSRHVTVPATESEVRRARQDDLQALGATLAAAFDDDPVVDWWVPDPVRRQSLLPAFFGLALSAYLPHGHVYATDRASAAAVWVPPGLEPDEADEARLLDAMADIAEETADRLLTVYEMLAEVHPNEPHAYLVLLAVRPERQGRGRGSALLDDALRRCDRDGTPAYLEATSEANRRLYLRHGFTDATHIQLPAGPPMWAMWREPQSGR